MKVCQHSFEIQLPFGNNPMPTNLFQRNRIMDHLMLKAQTRFFQMMMLKYSMQSEVGLTLSSIISTVSSANFISDSQRRAISICLTCKKWHIKMPAEREKLKIGSCIMQSSFYKQVIHTCKLDLRF